ncbi:hypothetical protein BU225_00595 [Stenotrophomonas sp. MB339]|nr:hypothetical protein BU225_00595 [Stenotrophomonas sp. MB339]
MECGAEVGKWQGACTECDAWISLSEIVLESTAGAKAPRSPARFPTASSRRCTRCTGPATC